MIDRFIEKGVLVSTEGICGVQIGEEVRTGDLYYLGIDPRNKDHECSVDVGLVRLINGWIETLLANEGKRIFCLPFDFSDEFTRWLACEKNGNRITVVFGWAEVEGWSFSPSEFSEHSRDLKGFRPDEPTNPQTFYLPRLLRTCGDRKHRSAKKLSGT